MTTASFDPRGIREAAVLTVGLTLMSYVVFVASPLADGEPLQPIVYGVLAISVIPGLVLLPGFFFLVRAIEAWSRPWKITIVGLVAVGLAILHAVVDTALVEAFLRAVVPGSVSPISIGGSVVIYVWVYGMFAAVVGLMLSNLAVQHRERLLAEARDAANQAQMAALRFQLNPHFLFNTLNAISSLIVTRDNDQAEAMMEKLSDFLRATLADDPHQFVTLDAELDMVRAYLDIERVRFGQRLLVEVECPAALRSALTPSFLLQPLVENAIKYAVAPSRTPVVIRVIAHAAGDDLILSVEDEGASVRATPKAGVGVGLANVRSRLAVLYAERGRLAAGRHQGGFRCVVSLPRTFAEATHAVAA
jgi:hypothetical protein